MKKNEFDELKQGFKEALDFINHKTVPNTEVDTLTVKRIPDNKSKADNTKDDSC